MPSWKDVDLARLTHEYLRGLRGRPCPTCGAPIEIARSREPPQPPIKLAFRCQACNQVQQYQRPAEEVDPEWLLKERRMLLEEFRLGIKNPCPRDETPLRYAQVAPRPGQGSGPVLWIYCEWCGRKFHDP